MKEDLLKKIADNLLGRGEPGPNIPQEDTNTGWFYHAAVLGNKNSYVSRVRIAQQYISENNLNIRLHLADGTLDVKTLEIVESYLTNK